MRGPDPLDRRLDRVGRRRPRVPSLPTGARWLAAAVLLGLAAVVLNAPSHAVAAPTEEVLVAAHDIAPGVPLRASDVRLSQLPVSAAPDGVQRSGSRVVGRELTAPARRGEPITDVRLLGTALLRASGGAGLVAAPVRVADAGAVALLHPGDRVDVLAVATDPAPTGDSTRGGGDDTSRSDGSATVVATSVVILTVPTSAATVSADGSLVVVATTPGIAARLAGAAVHARLSLTLHGR